ncbi:MAG: M24 family metallopeptidase [Streptosporangiaceae bacterium]
MPSAEARATAAQAAEAAARAARAARAASASEVAEKLTRVRGWLDESGYGAALFTSQPSVAWVTAGLEDRVCRNEEPGLVWALVTGTGAFLITTSIELPRLAAEEDCTELEPHAVPWYSPGGLALAADRLAGGLKLAEAPAALRMLLTAAEQDRLAALGADCARALEGVLRGWQPIERECDLAARIAGALEERLIFPSVLLVGGAERRRAFRHPVPTTAITGRDALAVVTGVRGGLNVSCSRTVSAGAPDPELAARHLAACSVEAALIHATVPGRSWEEALAAGQAAYRDAGFDGEWREHVQGGYLSREFGVVPGRPDAAGLITVGSAFAWNPTVRGAKSEDTFVVSGDGPAVAISNTPDWPTVAGPASRPAILST